MSDDELDFIDYSDSDKEDCQESYGDYEEDYPDSDEDDPTRPSVPFKYQLCDECLRRAHVKTFVITQCKHERRTITRVDSHLEPTIPGREDIRVWCDFCEKFHRRLFKRENRKMNQQDKVQVGEQLLEVLRVKDLVPLVTGFLPAPKCKCARKPRIVTKKREKRKKWSLSETLMWS